MRSTILVKLATWLALIGLPVNVAFMAARAAAPYGDGRERDSSAALAVAAVVNGTPIYDASVLREFERAVGVRQVEEQTLPVLQAQLLDHLIDRQLVLEFLSRKRLGATAEDVDAELSRLEKRLAQRGKTLQQYLAEKGLDTAQLRRELEWRIGWPRYAQRYLTDAKLQQYFQQHRRDFDGTRLRVAHILFSSSQSKQTESGFKELLSKARTVRDMIISGKMSFSGGAVKHSSAPTADRGGLIGSISRHEPMPESFSRAAFSLDVGQVSPPVVTAFGVHLIQCLEIVPGERSWEDARAELRAAVTRYVFEQIASRERQDAKIEFTGSMPYFSTGSRKLVASGQKVAG